MSKLRIVGKGLYTLVMKGQLGNLVSSCILKGSGDLVARVINRVTILIITYNPDLSTYNCTY